MKKKWFDYVLLFITFIFVSLIFFMPEIVPVHWGINGDVDRYGSRYELIIIAFLPIITYYGMSFTKKIDPKYENIKEKDDIYEFFRMLLTVFFIVLCIFVYMFSANLIKINGSVVIGVLIGCMFIAIGNYMPKVPQNYFLGIKTPWAIENEVVWQKTHRMGGHLFVLEGLIVCVCVFVELKAMVYIILGSSVCLTLFLTMYSYNVYKKLKEEG